jgi:hypothetical protein
VLERRLDKAPVVNGEPFLGSLGSGTRRIGAEAALTDAMGVLRGGAYGPGLNSLLNPLRGDAGVEETLRALELTPALSEPGDQQPKSAVAKCKISESKGCTLHGSNPLACRAFRGGGVNVDTCTKNCISWSNCRTTIQRNVIVEISFGRLTCTFLCREIKTRICDCIPKPKTPTPMPPGVAR